MEQKVKDYIEKNHMLTRGCHVVAGLSGGADSVCLLYLLREMAPEWQLTLEAVHVNHLLRGEEAMADARWVEALCGRLDVPLTVEETDVAALAKDEGLSVEEAGRQARYECFQRRADLWKKTNGGSVRIAVAHHSSDNCETVLMHLFRGAGLRGLGGIPPVRGQIIRPLLCVTREEIRQWLTDRQISWREDRTNADTAYARNFIRHKVVAPVEEAIQPRLTEHVSRTADMLRQLNGYVERQARQFVSRHCDLIYDLPGAVKGVRIHNSAFSVTDRALRPYVIQAAADRAGISAKDWTYGHYEAVAALFQKETGDILDLPGDAQAGCAAGEVWMVKGRLASLPMEPVEVTVPGSYTLLQAGERWHFRLEPAEKFEIFKENCKTPYTKCFDYDKIKKSLWLRSRREGDYMLLPAGRGRQKLQDYMVNEKIPRWQRDHIPLLACGDMVLWVASGKSSGFPVTGETKRILVAEREILNR